jgi:hypothetical protein
MNKYTETYLNKLSEDLYEEDEDAPQKQNPTAAGALGAIGSTAWPLGALAPGVYAGAQSKSLGQGLRATGAGLAWPLIGSLGGGAIGAGIGGTVGGLLGLASPSNIQGGGPNSSYAERIVLKSLGGAGAGGIIGALLGAPIAGYYGSKASAKKYNRKLDKKREDSKKTPKEEESSED